MNKIFLKIVNLIIELIDYSGKKKIINFFKKKFLQRKLDIIDIGTHKGETIDLFFKNFLFAVIFFKSSETFFLTIDGNFFILLILMIFDFTSLLFLS